MGYNINENFFDIIDTEEKSYWLGFIWGDGYTQYRDKRGYTFKLELAKIDEEHLEKFKKSLKCDKKILRYYTKSSFGTFLSSRFSLYKRHFVQVLRDKYGIISRRSDFSKIIENIPFHLHKHLLRGLLDADGSITYRVIKHKKCNRLEWSIDLIGSDSVLDWYNDLLIKNNLTKSIYKRSVRHEGKDEGMSTIRITGNIIAENILDFIYENSNIYLDRKYRKYLKLKEYKKQYNEEENNEN